MLRADREGVFGSHLAFKRFSTYLYGLDSFTVQTDHKPLAPLINNKDLDTVPQRYQCLLMCLMRYNPTAEYVPGETLTVADTLSRQPLPVIQHEISELTCNFSVFEDAAHTALPVTLQTGADQAADKHGP